MRSGSEHQPVLGLLVGIASDPALRLERIGIRVRLRVVERHVCRGDNHGALGRSIGIGDGEGLLRDVGNHDDRRAVAEGLLDDRARPL